MLSILLNSQAVTVPIVMDLKEEWKCIGNSMENMHTDVRV